MDNNKINNLQICNEIKENSKLDRETSQKLTGYASIDMPWTKYYSDDAMNFDFPKHLIYDAVYEENIGRKDNFAISYGDLRLKYGDFFDKVEERTEYFRQLGVKKGDIVTISMLMTPEFIYDFYALSRLGIVTNLIDPRTSISGIEKYIKEAQSDIILNTDIFTNKLLEAISNNDIKIINSSLIDSSEKIEIPLVLLSKIIKTVNSIKNKDNNHFQLHNQEPILNHQKYQHNLPLTIVHTGGTTGIPKGVVLSHDNYNAMAYSYIKSGIGFMPKDKFLLIMPPWISYGSGMLHLSMVRGMESIIIPKLNSKKMGEYILNFKPQWFAGVPAHYQVIKNSKCLKNQDLSYVKGGAVGGDGMSEKLYEESNEFLLNHGAKKGVYPGYALTESTSAFAVRQLGEYKNGSVGIPLPGCTVGIFEYDFNADQPTTKELKYNEKGEICLCTNHMMKGYFKNEELTDKVLRRHPDGQTWIHTGDLGYVDEDGYIYIDGRIKEMIVRHDGFKIYPKVIEKIVLTHKAIENVKVVGIEDKQNKAGSVPKVCITLKKEYEQEENKVIKELKKILSSELPEYYIPNDYEVYEKLPLTAIGKIDAASLKKNSKKRVKKLR